MKRYASMGFGAVLAAGERDAVMRAVRSATAAVTSWKTTATRTYVTVEADADDALQQLRAIPGASLDVPALAVLRIVPDAPRALPRLMHALGGKGRPAGVRAAYRDGDAVVVEVDASRTPLGFVIALCDAELATTRGRTIEPLVAFDDAALTALAGDLLGARGLDPARLIETHVAALLPDGQR